MSNYQQFDDEKLVLLADASIALDITSLTSILRRGVGVPIDIVKNTYLCWANVLIMLVCLTGKKIGKTVANHVFRRIRDAKSQMMSPIEMPELIDFLEEFTLVEYSMVSRVGWTIGPATGKKIVFLCNTGNHYQIFVRHGATLANLNMVVQPVQYMLFPGARKVIEGTALDKDMLAEVQSINDKYEQSDIADALREIDIACKLNEARTLQELADSALAQKLADQHEARTLQELADSAFAQELADSAFARELAGLAPLS
jgi:hypothetical protein